MAKVAADTAKEVFDGERYHCVYCENCAEPIPLLHDPSGGANNITGSGARFEKVLCGHCGQVADYEVEKLAHLRAVATS